MKLGDELRPNKDIDTILFDLDGTLRQNRPTFNEAMLSFTLRMGIANGDENARQAHRWLHYYWAQSPELVNDLENYEDYNEQFWINHARHRGELRWQKCFL